MLKEFNIFTRNKKNSKFFKIYTTKKGHPFQIIPSSPWPILTSFTIFFLALSLVFFFHNYKNSLFLLTFNVFLLIFILSFWWKDMTREALYLGVYTKAVRKNLYIGMLFFIFSEIMFFIGFFWVFIASALNPSIWVGGIWPPVGLVAMNPFGVPLANTIILLTSGIMLTWSHKAVSSIKSTNFTRSFSLFLTILFAIFFLILQSWEYLNSPFNISDSVYGSCFFMLTGLHGFHVFIGLIFLIVCFLKLKFAHYSVKNHPSFLCAIWYWHFVDVVWLFVYSIIYVWGS